MQFPLKPHLVHSTLKPASSLSNIGMAHQGLRNASLLQPSPQIVHPDLTCSSLASFWMPPLPFTCFSLPGQGSAEVLRILAQDSLCTFEPKGTEAGPPAQQGKTSRKCTASGNRRPQLSHGLCIENNSPLPWQLPCPGAHLTLPRPLGGGRPPASTTVSPNTIPKPSRYGSFWMLPEISLSSNSTLSPPH